jgi:hypothetical protein
VVVGGGKGDDTAVSFPRGGNGDHRVPKLARKRGEKMMDKVCW